MNEIRKSKRKRPRKVITQAFPWSTPETTLHYDAQKTPGTFCRLFSFASFEITSEVTRFNESPCTVFFDCGLLQDLPYYNAAKGVAQKGTALWRIEFRPHCSLMLYATQSNSIFNDCESVCFTFALSWCEREFAELYGCRGLGYKGAPEVLSKTTWALSLKCVEPPHLELSGGVGACTLLLHFPSFEFEMLGHKVVPRLTFYTDRKK